MLIKTDRTVINLKSFRVKDAPLDPPNTLKRLFKSRWKGNKQCGSVGGRLKGQILHNEGFCSEAEQKRPKLLFLPSDSAGVLKLARIYAIMVLVIVSRFLQFHREVASALGSTFDHRRLAMSAFSNGPDYGLFPEVNVTVIACLYFLTLEVQAKYDMQGNVK